MTTWLRRALPLAFVAAVSCKPATPAAAPPTDVLVTVNGAPISDVELQMYALSAARRADPETPRRAQDTLDSLVTLELQAQRALALGLDRDPRYAEAFQLAEARHSLWRRKELAAMARRDNLGKVAPTEADARKFFDDNTALVRSEFELLRTARNGQPAMQLVLDSLKAGKPFEELAAAQFPNLPVDQKPWEMGWVNWAELPLDWRPVVAALAPGGVSAPIKGVGTQLWLVQVKGKRENATLTFDKQKAAIMETLRVSREEEAQKRLDADLRGKADVKVTRPPVLKPPSNRPPED